MFNNLIRSDRPESPTDVIFIFGSLILIGLWIYATVLPCTIPHIETITLFLVGCKGVKVAGSWRKGGKSADTPA